MKIDKAKRESTKKKKKKWEQIMQNAQKKGRGNNFSLEVNTAILEPFWISELWELNILGLWKRSENFLTFVLQQGKRKNILPLVLHECTSQLNKSNCHWIYQEEGLFYKGTLYLFEVW